VIPTAVLCTLIAQGILAPWVIPTLGFGELGPIKGKSCVLLECLYEGRLREWNYASANGLQGPLQLSGWLDMLDMFLKGHSSRSFSA